MVSLLKAITILYFCVAVAASLIWLVDRSRNMMPHVIAWGLLVPVIFLTRSYPLIMGILVLLKLFYLKNDLRRNIAMFLSLMVVMPYSFVFQVVPGINLFEVSIVQMMSLVFFLPLVPRIITDEERGLHHFDVLAMAVIGILIVGCFRETSVYEFTWFQAFRDMLEVLLVVAVPYFVISRGIHDFQAMDDALAGLLMGGLTMAIFSVFEELMMWRPYVEIGTMIGTMSPLESMYEMRGGFLRISATLTGPITYSFYLTIIMGALMYFLRSHGVRAVYRWGGAVFLLGVIFMTGSRAGLLGGLLFMALYAVHSMHPVARRLLIIPLILVAVAGTLFSEAKVKPHHGGDDLNKVDQYGTFEYRKKLFFTALQVIPDHLLFGNRKFREDPRMEKMRQGQGIIDMVNGFVHLTIEYGLIALIALLLLLFRDYRVLTENITYLDADGDDLDPWANKPDESGRLAASNGDFTDEDDEARPLDISPAQVEKYRAWFAQAFAAMLVSICMQFAFTSYASTIVPLFWIMLALIRAYQLMILEEEERAEAEAEPGWQAVSM